MGYPVEFIADEPGLEAQGFASVRPLPPPERRRCLDCGYELMGPLAERLTDCPQCGTGFSVWALPEVRPLPIWFMTAWALSPSLLALAQPAWEPAVRDGDIPVWMVPLAGLAILYAWSCRLLRERRVPLRGLFAVPVTFAAVLPAGFLTLMFGFAMLSNRAEAPLVVGLPAALPVFAMLYWVLRRERVAPES